VLGDQLEGASDEEKARLYKATWWADNITNAEWPALLGREGASKTAKSRLKRKTVGQPHPMFSRHDDDQDEEEA
jgi:hypothetical protein